MSIGNTLGTAVLCLTITALGYQTSALGRDCEVRVTTPLRTGACGRFIRWLPIHSQIISGTPIVECRYVGRPGIFSYTPVFEADWTPRFIGYVMTSSLSCP
jgi:hypothetical protein